MDKSILIPTLRESEVIATTYPSLLGNSPAQRRVMVEQLKLSRLLEYVLSVAFMQQKRGQVYTLSLELPDTENFGEPQKVQYKCVILSSLDKYPSAVSDHTVLDLSTLYQHFKDKDVKVATREALDKLSVPASGGDSATKGYWFQGQALHDWWGRVEVCEGRGLVPYQEYLKELKQTLKKHSEFSSEDRAALLKRVKAIFPPEQVDWSLMRHCDTPVKKEFCCLMTDNCLQMLCFAVLSAGYHVLAAVPYEPACFIPEEPARDGSIPEYVYLRKKPLLVELHNVQDAIRHSQMGFLCAQYMDSRVQSLVFPTTISSKVYKCLLEQLLMLSRSCPEFELKYENRDYLIQFDEEAKKRERVSKQFKQTREGIKQIVSQCTFMRPMQTRE